MAKIRTSRAKKSCFLLYMPSEWIHASIYTVNVYLQDGIITDMGPTVNRIVPAFTLPLSIVIVGVGTADFTTMHGMWVVVHPVSISI